MSATILYYHRVADIKRDPLLLAVSQDNFARQLEILDRYHTVVPLEELYSERKVNRTKSLIALTFDDGYADNLHVAGPILEAAGMHATIFATVAPSLAGELLWWDELEYLLFSGTFDGPILLELEAQHIFELDDSSALTKEELARFNRWNVLCEDAPMPRHTAYMKLLGLMQPLAEHGKQAVLQQIRMQQTAYIETDRLQLPMTPDELKQAHSKSHLSVGCHTMHHPILSRMTDEIVAYEVKESKRQLEEILGTPQAIFSYPYGRYADINQQVTATVAEAGFEYACTTIPGHVDKEANPLLLPRFGVRDLNSEAFSDHLNACINWGEKG